MTTTNRCNLFVVAAAVVVGGGADVAAVALRRRSGAAHAGEIQLKNTSDSHLLQQCKNEEQICDKKIAKNNCRINRPCK